MSKNKELAVNITANFIYMILNYAITFFLTSFVVTEISGEAYGFISLCNNVVNYATLVTVALNSVSGRFITIEMHRGNKKKANEYFSSTLAADIIMCIGILLIFVPIAIKVDSIFEIPSNIVEDVRVLFLFVTFNLIITVISTVYTVATFITNKLYLSSIANALGNIARVLSLIYFMNFKIPNIKYVGVATIVSSVIILALNFSYTYKLCPELRVERKAILFIRVRELLMSGIWNSVTKLAQILSDGIDLVISNIWVGAYDMGQLSIAYTIPTIVSAFLAMLINVFNPKLTEYYAKRNKKKIIYELKLNMKMTAFFGNVLFFGVITIGKDFFKLWVPTANIDMVYTLMVLATVSVLVSSVVAPLSNVFLLTNKLKVNSLVWLGVSFFDAIIVIILLNTTNLGVYAVAGVSKIVGAIVNLVFLPNYASKCLKVRPIFFYAIILKYALSTVGVGIAMNVTRMFLGSDNSWILFGARVVCLSLVGLGVNYKFFLNKRERVYLKNTLKSKIIRER